MPTTHQISPGHDFQIIAGKGIFVFGEQRRFFSDSRVLINLLPLIDGRRTDDDIAVATRDLSPAEVYFGLGQLRKAGVLQPVEMAVPTDNAQHSLTCGSILITGRADAGVKALEAQLRDRNVPVARRDGAIPPPIDLTVLLLRDLLGPEAEEDMGRRAQGGPWICVKLVGERALISPVFGTTAQPCWECMNRHLRENRPLERWLERTCGRTPGLAHVQSPTLGAAGRAAAGMAAGLIARILAGESLVDVLPHAGFFEWNGSDRAGFLHPAPIGRCANCAPAGAPYRTDTPPERFDPTHPITAEAAGLRIRPAAATASLLAPLVSDLTGRISRIGPLETGDPARHVWAAVYPITPASPHITADGFHRVALGKGKTAAQAEASAICEAVERMSAHYREGLAERYASLQELGEDAVDPTRIACFSETQYRDRDRWNAATQDTRRHIPPRLSPDQRISWVKGWSLTFDRWRWLPREHCVANTPGPTYGRYDPNGAAAGNCLEEAILQGFLELVERDCVAIWWANRLHLQGFEVEDIKDPEVRRIGDGIRRQGWQVWLLDLTSDLGLPCVAALARAHSDGHWCIGFGCHFFASLAAERAVTELAQLFRESGRDGPAPWQAPVDGDDRYLFPHGAAAPRDADIAHLSSLLGLVDWSRDLLRSKAIEMIVFDQTDPAIGLPVAKVTAPGLRHFWPRFGPGRLYDVPVTLGQRKSALAEVDLNPSYLFL